MPRRDDRLKKYQEAGADFLETARTRAEEFLSELAKAGDTTQSRAQGALDELMESSRRGTEHLLGLIRNEITSQLGSLGLATKDDLAALERRVKAGAAQASPAKRPGTRKAPAARKAPSARKVSAAQAAPAKRAGAAKKAAPAKRAGAAKKAAPAKKAQG